MLGALSLLVVAALSAPTLTIDAHVDPDLRTIRGTLTWDGPDATWADPLARLPEPPDDLNARRTYPSRANRGEVRWTQDAQGVLHFETRLPRRFGALGSLRRGLFANGGWHPQPLVDGALVPAEYTVTVALPEGATGALGDQIGSGTLRWSGEYERASLAVLRRGTTYALESGAALLSHRRKPRRMLVRALDSVAIDVNVVEAPMRRRLVRPGAEVAFVSDRAFRLTGGFQRLHKVGLSRGLATSAEGHPEPFARQVLAAAHNAPYEARLKGTNAIRAARWLRWMPSIDFLVSSRQIPFYSEIFEEVFPGDVVQDDLVEVLDPNGPGQAAYAQLLDAGETEALDILVQKLEMGQPLSVASMHLDPAWRATWTDAYPVQDYTLEVSRERRTVAIQREVEEGPHASETVVLKVNDRLYPLPAEGLSPIVVTFDEPLQRVVLDPARHLQQTSRAGESWPIAPLRWTASGGITAVNLTQFRIEGLGVLTLRGAQDTHNIVSGSLYTTRRTLFGTRLSYSRKQGRLLDGFRRPHRATVWVSPRTPDRNYARIEGDIAVDGGLSYSFDNRVSSDFPLRGARFGAWVNAGAVPGSNQDWSAMGISALAVGALHPRVTLAARSSLAKAWSSVLHEYLPLGGSELMRSVPALPACGVPEDPTDPCEVPLHQRLHVAQEFRVAPLRNANVPLFLLWGTELQLTAGLEGIAGTRVDGDPAFALGGTLGIAGVGDILGIQSQMIGLTAGWALLENGVPSAPIGDPFPELYLRWYQAF